MSTEIDMPDMLSRRFTVASIRQVINYHNINSALQFSFESICLRFEKLDSGSYLIIFNIKCILL